MSAGIKGRYCPATEHLTVRHRRRKDIYRLINKFFEEHSSGTVIDIYEWMKRRVIKRDSYISRAKRTYSMREISGGLRSTEFKVVGFIREYDSLRKLRTLYVYAVNNDEVVPDYQHQTFKTIEGEMTHGNM